MCKIGCNSGAHLNPRHVAQANHRVGRVVGLRACRRARKRLRSQRAADASTAVRERLIGASATRGGQLSEQPHDPSRRRPWPRRRLWFLRRRPLLRHRLFPRPGRGYWARSGGSPPCWSMCSSSAKPPLPQAEEAALWSVEEPPDYQSVPSPRQSRRDLLSCSGLPRLAGESPWHWVTPRLLFSGSEPTGTRPDWERSSDRP